MIGQILIFAAEADRHKGRVADYQIERCAAVEADAATGFEHAGKEFAAFDVPDPHPGVLARLDDQVAGGRGLIDGDRGGFRRGRRRHDGGSFRGRRLRRLRLGRPGFGRRVLRRRRVERWRCRAIGLAAPALRCFQRQPGMFDHRPGVGQRRPRVGGRCAGLIKTLGAGRWRRLHIVMLPPQCDQDDHDHRQRVAGGFDPAAGAGQFQRRAGFKVAQYRLTGMELRVVFGERHGRIHAQFAGNSPNVALDEGGTGQTLPGLGLDCVEHLQFQTGASGQFLARHAGGLAGFFQHHPGAGGDPGGAGLVLA